VSLGRVSIAFLTLSLAAACTSSGESSSSATQGLHRAHPDADVVIDSFTFLPAALRVSVGEIVTWVNHDATQHTVTSGTRRRGAAGAVKPGEFDHGLELDDTFSFTFERAGTFAYHCDVHPRMRGRIVVG
jgi:plastocyanin